MWEIATAWCYSLSEVLYQVFVLLTWTKHIVSLRKHVEHPENKPQTQNICKEYHKNDRVKWNE